MPRVAQFFLLFSACAAVFALGAQAQDQPSLGDVARQARLQKQQKEAQADKEAQTKDATAKDAQSDSQAKDDQGKDAQAKDGQSKDSTVPTAKAAKRVITNDEIPEHVGPTSTANSARPPTVYYPQQPNYSNELQQLAGEQWKASILSMKNYLANLQAQISNVEQSIQYAGGNCVSGCVQWNERQKQKQDQVVMMKQQLEQGHKRLEEMQEMARRQGYGSSVYDP
jgi:uncharacterized iron-regulated membrane protein